MNHMGPEKMKAAMPTWLPHYASKSKLSKEINSKLMSMSASTIARILKPTKDSIIKSNKSQTQSNHLFKYKIPVRPFQQNINSPGFVQGDSVAHCGTSIEGPHYWTLTVTDIHTTWTENEIIEAKTAKNTKIALADIQARLPFVILNFHTDCGNEFLNYEIMDYLKNPNCYIVQTRGRAYKENDQAHVEQKNNTHVRNLLGYHRYDRIHEFNLIKKIYQNEWRLLMNFFTPQRKMLTKHKVRSKYIRKYGPMMTPYQRVLQSKHVSEQTKTQLSNQFKDINPIELVETLNLELKKLMNFKNRSDRKVAI